MAKVIFAAVFVVLALQLCSAQDETKKVTCMKDAVSQTEKSLCDKFKECCKDKCGGKPKNDECVVENNVISLAKTDCVCGASTIIRANIFAIGAIMAIAFLSKMFN